MTRTRTKSNNTTICKLSMLFVATTLTIVSFISPTPIIFAQTGNNNMSSMENIALNLGTPIFIEHTITTRLTNPAQNVIKTTFEGNGTFMLPPPTGRNVSTIDSGNRVTTTIRGISRAGGQVLIKTADGKESALINFAEFQPVDSTRGVGIAYIQTNTTTTEQQQQLASLNNTLMIYKTEAISPIQSIVTFWKWSPGASSSKVSLTLSSSNSSSSTFESRSNSTSISNPEKFALNLGTPLLIEHAKTTNLTNITQNISNSTFEGNGTFMLPPPTGRNVSTIDSGNTLTGHIKGLALVRGQILLRSIDGKESALINFAGFKSLINSTIAIGIAYIQTNTTTTEQQQQLASLNNTLGIFKSDHISMSQYTLTLWVWK